MPTLFFLQANRSIVGRLAVEQSRLVEKSGQSKDLAGNHPTGEGLSSVVRSICLFCAMQGALDLIDGFSYQYLEAILIVLMNPDINQDVISFCQREIANFVKCEFYRYSLLAEYILRLYFDRSLPFALLVV